MKYAYLLIGLFIVQGAFAESSLVSIEAIGVVLNDVQNPLDTNRRALIEAQRMAIEKATGVSITAHSTVDKSILTENTIRAETEGRIRTYSVESEKVEGIYYKVKIKAEVELNPSALSQEEVLHILSTVELSKWYGIYFLVNGKIPTDIDLKNSQATPLPLLKSFVLKLKSQTKNVPDTLLLQSVVTQLGLYPSGNLVSGLQEALQ